MNKRIAFIFALVLFVFKSSYCTLSSVPAPQPSPGIEISGFADVFYCFDFNRPTKRRRQPFFYNHNRHSSVELNLALLKLQISQPKYRIALAAHTGTYSRDNYSSEPGLLKNIFEASVGVSLNRKNNLWIDAGIFSSHIGFESAISMDSWTLTRSLISENSPYYLSGLKVSYIPNSKWETALIMCNGWQRIHFIRGASLPSFGTLLKFTPHSDISMAWSTFLGTNDPDSSRRMRYFSNLYLQWKLGNKFGLIAAFDVGAQQQSKKSKKYKVWFSPDLIIRYVLAKQWSLAFRAEYYQDAHGVMIPTETVHGFKTTSLSLNLDYQPYKNLICRVEGRWLNSKDQIFESGDELYRNNFFITVSAAVRFSRLLSARH